MKRIQGVVPTTGLLSWLALCLLTACSDGPTPQVSDAGGGGGGEPPGTDASVDAALDAEAGQNTADAGAADAASDAGPDAMAPAEPGLSARPVNGSCFAPKRGEPLPKLLSETGCFSSSQPPEPQSGLIPFDLNAALWSDHAAKDRWMSLPSGATLDVLADGDLVFPVGTVLIKTFTLEGRKLETRFLMYQPADVEGYDGGMPTEAGWEGFSYKWREDQLDADLIGLGEEGVSFDVLGPSGVEQTWTIPVASCLNCHNAAVGRSIGIELAQLNRDFTYPSTGRKSNQIHTWQAIGIFSAELPEPEAWPRLIPYADETHAGANPSATPTELARSYLHSNCAFCHRRPTAEGAPDGPGINEDFRVDVPFEDMKSCNAGTTNAERYGLADLLLVPGMPDGSSLLQRMRDKTPLGQDKQAGGFDRARMPPVGTTLVHPLGVNIVAAWITQITECPE